ncbi:hypothetical protein [Shiella aurantiaca]|nr:hypothetical protein [Shiella aurantiaca]
MGFPQLSGFDRPLNEKRLRDVQSMGQRLKALGIRPDVQKVREAVSTAN